jgi:hypothetical protein
MVWRLWYNHRSFGRARYDCNAIDFVCKNTRYPWCPIVNIHRGYVESLSSPSFNLRGTGLCVLGYRGSKTDKVNSVDWPDARVLPLSTREVCDNVVARESAVDTISSAVDEPDRTRSSEPDVSDISNVYRCIRHSRIHARKRNRIATRTLVDIVLRS